MTEVLRRNRGGFVSASPIMTDDGAALKARGYPPIFCENRFLPRPLRGACRGPDNPAVTRLLEDVLDFGNGFEEVVMTGFVQLSEASDRVMSALIAGLKIEFGLGADTNLTRHYLQSEEVDFHWDARVSERWLGTYESIDDDVIELDRIAIYGRLDSEWFAAICIIDGDGNPHDMISCRTFDSKVGAKGAYQNAR